MLNRFLIILDTYNTLIQIDLKIKSYFRSKQSRLAWGRLGGL